MANWFTVVSMILSVLFSDTFKKLIEMALEVIKELMDREDLSDSEKRLEAIDRVRLRARAAGLVAGQWLAGYAVESALVVAKPSRARSCIGESEKEEVKEGGDSGEAA